MSDLGHTLLGWLPNVIYLVVFFWWLDWTERPKRACRCPKSRRFYFDQPHRKVGWMIGFGVWTTLGAVASVIDVVGLRDWPNAVAATIVAAWTWRWVWFHEKDKIKRAARALGRVFVTEHGTLAVSTER